MQAKKVKIGIGLIAFLLLCSACVRPTPTPTPIATMAPTATVTPAETPAPSPTEAVQETPAPTPTKVPEETATPTPSETPVPKETGMPTPTAAVQETLTPTPTVSQTPMPKPTETLTPMPTHTPTPVVTEVPQVTVTPAPQINAAELVNYGWQRVTDLTDTYWIIFPETFTTSEITRTEEGVTFLYKSEEDAGITFTIRFLFQKEFDLLADEIGENHVMQEGVLEEQRSFTYWGEISGIVTAGTILEHFYAAYVPTEDETQPKGSLWIEFMYPDESRERYETGQYQYYIIPIP